METSNTKYQCEHNRIKYVCKECCGSRICEHNKRKECCKDCGGSQICEHGKIRHSCTACGGGSICEHKRVRTYCKECRGGSICEHGKRKSICKDCGGGSICDHGRERRYCRECGGRGICEHNKLKFTCPDCNGSQICKSRYEPYKTGCRTLGNRNLRGFCSHCFVNLFPDDPKALTVRTKSKEMQVVSYILSKFDGFIHDKPFYVDLEGGCCASKRRVDLRKLVNSTMLCIEIDEGQHKTYIKERENARYDDLFMDFSGKYIFIRYNPDKFKDKYGKMKNPFFETRVEVLEKAIEKHILRIIAEDNDNLVEIHHLFYDEA